MPSFNGSYQTTEHPQYTEYTVTSGRLVVSFDNDDTLSNALFDITAPGTSVTLAMHGTNNLAQNVGVRGEFSTSHRVVGVSDRHGGHTVLRNCYFGDGSDASAASHWSDPSFGPWVAPQHNGDLTFDRCYVEGALDNGFYASAPGSNSNGGGGLVHFKNCYAKNNLVSNFRTAGGTIDNCVSVVTSEIGTDVQYNPRPLWAFENIHTDITEVRNSHFIRGPFDFSIRARRPETNLLLQDIEHEPPMSNDPDATVIENNVGTNPQDFIPDGCPTSPEMAAAGDPWELVIDYDKYDDAEQIYNQTSHARGYHVLESGVPTMMGDTALRVRFREGVNHNGNSWLMLDDWPELSNLNQHGMATAVRQSWWIYVPEDFNYEAGGRFYAAAYTPGSGSSGGGDTNGSNGWSVRGARQNGPAPWDLSVQVYAAEGPGNHYFEHSNLIDHGWTHLETFVQANTISGGSGNEDGEIRIWVDGDLVHESDGWLWTHDHDNFVERCGVGTWMVGSGATQDYDFYYDGHAIDTSGDNPTEPYGPPLTATQPSLPEPSGSYMSWPNGPSDLSRFTGATGDFEVVEGIGYEGDYALRRTSDQSHARILASTVAGPRRGVTFAQQYYPVDGDELFILHWAMGPNGERYIAQLRYDTDEIRIGYYDGDTTTWVNSSSLDTSGTLNEWGELHVDFGATSHNEIVTWFEDADGTTRGKTEMTHGSYDSGGIGYSQWVAGGGDHRARIDYLRRTDVDVPDDPEPVYTEHIVSAGDTFTKRFEPGETWENHLIDISAPGAEFDIFCREAGVTIRNIGIRGTHDSSDHGSRFRVESRDGDTSQPILVENVYLKALDAPEHNNSGMSLYSHPRHEGHITFRNVTLANLPDAGFYNSGSGLASDSDHPNADVAAGGTYRYENCHVTGCGTGHYRVTSDGSSLENCFAADGRGANTGLRIPWVREGATITATNCTFMDHGRDIDISANGSWTTGATGELEINNVRFDTHQIDNGTGDTIEVTGDGLSSAGPTVWLEPSDIGAPESAEEAAGGVRHDPPGPEFDPVQETFADGLEPYSGETDGFDAVGGE